MAKHSSTDIVKLLSTTERRLFRSSRGTELAKATTAELGKSIELARALRDKWQDQFRNQRRAGQTAARARGVDGNDRSEQKSQLFGEVLERLQARLAELGTSVSTAVASKRKASSRPSRAARTAGHRATRAGIRASLASFVTATPGTRTAAARPVAKTGTQPVEAKAAAAAKPIAGKGRTAAKAAAKVKLKAKKREKARAMAAAPTAIGRTTPKSKKKKAGFSPLAQLAASAQLKKQRLRLGGFDTRLRGHVSASGKRSQSRRDSRSR
jgi:hypothetical protein